MADKIGVSQRTLRAWRYMGIVPFVKVRKIILFSEEEVLQAPKNSAGRSDDEQSRIPPLEREKDRLEGRSGAARENSSNQTLQDSAPAVNVDHERRPIERQGNVVLFEISRGRTASYEVIAPTGRWCFSLLFQAESKFDRLTAERGGVIRRHNLPKNDSRRSETDTHARGALRSIFP